MWLLWLILTWPSTPGEHLLHTQYETYAACVTERNRMTKEFEQSYPGDTDYLFECRFIKKVI
jgi:hypothetical protein